MSIQHVSLLSVHLAILFLAYSALSLDLLDIKLGEKEKGNDLSIVEYVDLGNSETRSALTKVSNNLLSDDFICTEAPSVPIKKEIINQRNSINITKSFHNPIEDSKKSQGSLILSKSLQKKEIELVEFIQYFNSVTFIVYQNISQQCHRVVDNCKTVGIFENIIFYEDFFKHSGHFCLSQNYTQNHNETKFKFRKELMKTLEVGTISAVYRCLCSSLQFNLALNFKENQILFEMSNNDYYKTAIAFNLLRQFAVDKYHNYSKGNKKASSSPSLSSSSKLLNQLRSMTQKIHILEEISEFLYSTASYDAIVLSQALAEYSVSNPSEMIQLNFKRFLNIYLDYERSLHMEYPIDNRMLADSNRQFHEQEMIYSELSNLDAKKMENDAKLLHNITAIQHNISINQLNQKATFNLEKFKGYFNAFEAFEITSFEFLTSVLTNPLLAFYGALVGFVQKIIMTHIGSVGGATVGLLIIMTTCASLYGLGIFRAFYRFIIYIASSFFNKISRAAPAPLVVPGKRRRRAPING